MIVGSMFEGDDDKEVVWKQHGVVLPFLPRAANFCLTSAPLGQIEVIA